MRGQGGDAPLLIPLIRWLSRRRLSTLRMFTSAFFVHPSRSTAASISARSTGCNDGSAAMWYSAWQNAWACRCVSC